MWLASGLLVLLTATFVQCQYQQREPSGYDQQVYTGRGRQHDAHTTDEVHEPGPSQGGFSDRYRPPSQSSGYPEGRPGQPARSQQHGVSGVGDEVREPGLSQGSFSGRYRPPTQSPGYPEGRPGQQARYHQHGVSGVGYQGQYSGQGSARGREPGSTGPGSNHGQQEPRGSDQSQRPQVDDWPELGGTRQQGGSRPRYSTPRPYGQGSTSDVSPDTTYDDSLREISSGDRTSTLWNRQPGYTPAGRNPYPGEDVSRPTHIGRNQGQQGGSRTGSSRPSYEQGSNTYRSPDSTPGFGQEGIPGRNQLQGSPTTVDGYPVDRDRDTTHGSHRESSPGRYPGSTAASRNPTRVPGEAVTRLGNNQPEPSSSDNSQRPQSVDWPAPERTPQQGGSRTPSYGQGSTTGRQPGTPMQFPPDIQRPLYEIDPSARNPERPKARVEVSPLPLNATEMVAEATCRFSMDVFKAVLKNTPGNAIMSPLSVQTLLAMLQQGAKQGSSEQLEAILHLKPEVTRYGYSNVIKNFQRSSYALNFANKMYVSPDFDILPDFAKILRDDFKSSSEKLSISSTLSTQKINKWVAEVTKNRITQLVNPGDITWQTNMVLVNAIHFKSDWKQAFEPNDTVVEKFYTLPPPPLPSPLDFDVRSSPGRKGGPSRSRGASRSEDVAGAIDVQMMHITDLLRGGRNDDLGAMWVELPYDGDDFSMVLMLPTTKHDLDGVIERMTFEDLQRTMRYTTLWEVTLKMPRFKLHTQMSVRKVLSQLGLTDVFSSKSHLEGISSRTPLIVSEIMHTADIEVKEEGTEAAGSSGLYGTALTISPTYEVVKFNLTEPFLAIIIDNNNKMPLFMARVSNPGLETTEI